MSGTPYLEYGGLTSVPGPFHCCPATIYLAGLRADPDLLASLCRTVLVDPDGTTPYEPVGGFVVLSFGSMEVRSMSTDRSAFFDTTYADMGTSLERHAALWVPTVATHRADHAEFVDRLALFVPAMWVDNPVSLLGGRDIYGIAKQWGAPSVTEGERPACSLDVFGGDFGPDAASGMHPLLEFAPRGGIHPIEAVEEVAEEAGTVADDALRRLLRGEVTLPARSLLDEVARTVVDHQLLQVAARQFRTPRGDGSAGSSVELVELTSKFDTFHARPLHHGFDFTLHDLDSHPLTRTLGIASQTVPFAVEVTADFTLSAT